MDLTKTPNVLLQNDVPGFDPEPWRGELRAWLRKIGAGEDADDIVQETFLRAVRRPPTGKARPWLYGIALNLFRDRLRGRRRDQDALDRGLLIEDSVETDPSRAAEVNDQLQVAAGVIEELPKSQRIAVSMRLTHHKEYAEIGEALGCSDATARQHVYLGLKAVRTALLDGDR